MTHDPPSGDDPAGRPPGVEPDAPMQPDASALETAFDLRAQHDVDPVDATPSASQPVRAFGDGDRLVGTLVDGRYEIGRVLGRGGMGTVYAGLNKRLHDRPCAIKVLSLGQGGEEWLARFESEVRIVSALRSPNTVQILDTGNLNDGRPYIVMELLEGRTLSADLKTGPFALPRALRIMDGVLSALAEAHRIGVVHRDLKPANVFLVRSGNDADFPKVLDFGIAKQVDREGDDLTAHGKAIGTPKYMAPEQFRGPDIDQRADLYVCGVLLYFMIAGRPPFLPTDPVPTQIRDLPRDSRLGWLHLHQPPATVPQVPDHVWAVLERLLAKAPEDRFPDAASVRLALRQAEPGRSVLAPLAAGDVADAKWRGIEEHSSTGFPVAGEATGTADSLSAAGVGGGRSRLIAAALAILAVLSVGFWVVGGSSEPAPSPPRLAGAAPAPKMCTDTVESTPSGAQILRGDTPIGTTPAPVERPCRESWLVEVRLEHHRTAMVKLEGPGQARSARLDPIAPEPEPEPEPAVEPEPEVAPTPTAKPAPPGPAARPRPARARPAGNKPKPRAAKPKPPAAQPKPAKPADDMPALPF
jgi:serine/threonine-protein kinase